LTLTYKPWGTCTTPSVTVRFAPLFPGDLPADGPGPSTAPAATRTFTLWLGTCPQTNINYFFRAPTGIPVDNVNGVVGLDSTPGNAQGVGIQLRHNGSYAGSAPVKFNQDGDDTVYVQTPAMGHSYYGNGAITHRIPMRATIYRTSATPVVPGGINASVLVYIQYP